MIDDQILEGAVGSFCEEHALEIRDQIECTDPPGIYFDVRPSITDGIIGLFVDRGTGEISVFGFGEVNRSRKRAERHPAGYDPCTAVYYMLQDRGDPE